MFNVYRPRSVTRPITLDATKFTDLADVRVYNEPKVAPYPLHSHKFIMEKAAMGTGNAVKVSSQRFSEVIISVLVVQARRIKS